MRWFSYNHVRVAKESDITKHYVMEELNAKCYGEILSDQSKLFELLNPSKLIQLGMRCGWQLQLCYQLLGHQILPITIVHIIEVNMSLI